MYCTVVCMKMKVAFFVILMSLVFAISMAKTCEKDEECEPYEYCKDVSFYTDSGIGVGPPSVFE